MLASWWSLGIYERSFTCLFRIRSAADRLTLLLSPVRRRLSAEEQWKEKIQTLNYFWSFFLTSRREKKSSKIHHVINFFFLHLMKIRNYFFMNEKYTSFIMKRWKIGEQSGLRRLVSFVWLQLRRVASSLARHCVLSSHVKDQRGKLDYSSKLHTHESTFCLIESWEISHRLSNC